MSYRIGSISSGTLNPRDLADAFYFAADRIGGHHPEFIADHALRDSWWDRLGKIGEVLFPNDGGSMADDGETVADCVDELFELLGEVAPPYCYFGAHEGDGADFGFWPLVDAIQELEQFDAYPDTLPGDDFAVVNDHGNLSVYGADGKLLWDCV